jgi:hypothetical protein
MRAAYGVVFVDNVCAELVKTLSNSVLHLRPSNGYADVACTVGKMIANHRTVARGSLNNFFKCGSSLRCRGGGMRGDPPVHFRDVRRRNVRIEELLPVSSPPVCHQLRLTSHSSSASRDSDMGIWELSLKLSD